MPTGTYYTIAVGGDNVSEIVIEVMKEETYQRFTDCLWKAVCVRLIEQYLQTLKSGKQVSIGGVSFDDDGIYLTKHKLFGNETVYTKWGEVTYQTYNGELYITSKNDKKVYNTFSFLSVANTHILEAIIRLSFKEWNGHLSGLLGN